MKVLKSDHLCSPVGGSQQQTDWQTLQATGSFEAEVANFDKSRLSEVCILDNLFPVKKSLEIDDVDWLT